MLYSIWQQEFNLFFCLPSPSYQNIQTPLFPYTMLDTKLHDLGDIHFLIKTRSIQSVTTFRSYDRKLECPAYCYFTQVFVYEEGGPNYFAPSGSRSRTLICQERATTRNRKPCSA